MSKTTKQTSDLPLRPVGYHILVKLPPALQKTKGGIYIPQDTAEKEQTAAIVGQVVAKGPLAYSDKARAGDTPWCEVGDWILMASYAGVRFNSGEDKYRVINDDSVVAVVNHVERVERS